MHIQNLLGLLVGLGLAVLIAVVLVCLSSLSRTVRITTTVYISATNLVRRSGSNQLVGQFGLVGRVDDLSNDRMSMRTCKEYRRLKPTWS